jgi:hypothetical protein
MIQALLLRILMKQIPGEITLIERESSCGSVGLHEFKHAL